MASSVLFVHSLLRWIALLTLVCAFARALMLASGKKSHDSVQQKLGLFAMIGFDVQLLIGLILYVALSPVTTAVFQGLVAHAMKDRVIRFWLVEHPFGMIVAVAAIHIGRIRAKRAPRDQAKNKAHAVWFGIALLVTLASIPWPFLPYGRALVPSLP